METAKKIATRAKQYQPNADYIIIALTYDIRVV